MDRLQDRLLPETDIERIKEGLKQLFQLLALRAQSLQFDLEAFL